MSDLIRRDDVDPRNLANPRKLNGVPYTDYERGYNDGIIDAYWVIQRAKAVESEPMVHAHWIKHTVAGEDFFGLPVLKVWACNCSACGLNGIEETPRCPHCGAHMDECLEVRTCYCPICDKHFEVRSNDSGGSCPDCGHHVVLHKAEVVNA